MVSVFDSVSAGLELTLSDASPGAEDRWDRFAEAQPGASLCHLFGWRRIIEESYGLETRFLLAQGADDRIHGILPLVLVRGLTGRRTLVSMPFLDQGGILADSPAVYAALRQEALRLASSLRAGGLDLRGAVESGAGRGDRFLAVLPLARSRTELWKTIGPKVRNLVRKAERAGVTCQRADHSELPAFYRIFARNMWHAGSPVHAFGFFERILRRLSDRSTLYLARSQSGEPVAGALALRFRDTVTVPWASALPSALPLSPNYSLYWTALVDALECGAQFFDFGRSSAGSGTLHFKKQWGAELRPLAWTYIDRKGNEHRTNLLDPRKNRWMAQVWSRLPFWVANRLGPPARRRLSN